MMNRKMTIGSIIILLALAACTAAPDEQGAATLPPATTAPVEPTPMPAATSTILPEPSEEPTVPAPAAEELDAFVMQLETAVTNQDYAQMEALMSDPMGVGGWRSEWRSYEPGQMIAEFRNGALPAPLGVQFTGLTDDEMTTLIGQPPASLFGPDTNIVAALHSSGWGQSTSDDVILFVAEEDGHYFWHGFLYTSGRFADANLGSVAPPVGLIYRAAENGIVQIQTDGSHRQLFDEQTANIPNLQVAPDGRHAAYLNEERQLSVIDSVTGEQQQLAADFNLSNYLAWGDAHNLLLGVWLDPSEGDGPNNGHMTTANIDTGEIQILDEEDLMWYRPAMLADSGLVAFDVLAAGPDDIMNGRIYSPDTGLQSFDQSTFSASNEMISGPLFNAAWSPDGMQLSWLVTTGERFAVQLFDLEAKTAVQIFDWDPARFSGLVPSPVWNPDGQWLALDVWANGPEGSGIWLLAADGSSQTLVDAQGHDPYWVNDFQLIFNLNSEPRLYDTGSGEQFRLDLPETSRILNVTDPQELPGSSTSFEVVDTAVAYVQAQQDVTMYSGPGVTYGEIGGVFDGQTALVTGQSPDGNWWRVICPDDTVGDCWVTADTAYTMPSNAPDSGSGLLDPASLTMANEVTLPSPDDRRLATAAWSDPLTVLGQEKYYASLTVTDGDTVWTPIAEWRNYGLGYTWPSIVQWSDDGRYLYYTNEVSPDGCAVFATGTDLYRLAVEDGQVTELIPPGETLNFALKGDETAVAYTHFAGGQYSLIVQDISSGSEQSVNITEKGQDGGPGNIVWSPDGTQIYLVVAYNACSAPTNSILHIDAETMTATTLIENDARQFTILDIPGPGQEEVRLMDKDGNIWLLEANSGELTQE